MVKIRTGECRAGESKAASSFYTVGVILVLAPFCWCTCFVTLLQPPQPPPLLPPIHLSFNVHALLQLRRCVCSSGMLSWCCRCGCCGCSCLFVKRNVTIHLPAPDVRLSEKQEASEFRCLIFCLLS